MTNKNRLLITTSDERTWKFDRPVLFLGEWCRLYERKNVWETMDAIVARPYGLQDGQKTRNFAQVQVMADHLLHEAAIALNKFHHTQYGLRYWRIVIGHWLQRYVAVIFNRYYALEQALTEHDIVETVVLEVPDLYLTANDSLSFTWACNDPRWNNALYSKILGVLGGVNQEAASDVIETSHELWENSGQDLENKFSFKRNFKNAVQGAVEKLSRNNDAFIINSYLPFFDEIRLQLSLGQVPQFWRSPKVKHVLPDHSVRQKFTLNTEGFAGFELFLRCQFSEMIPTCYLEGYGQLIEQVKQLPWPSNPHFIFTSNRFDSDEVFKAWTASKIEQGVPYFVGQHGNNYGTHQYFGNQHWPELAAADRFFTWGWADGNPKNIPTFVFNIAGRKQRRAPPKGGLLLVECSVSFRFVPEDSYFEFGRYQEEQFVFIDSLPEAIQEQVTVRLYGGYKKLQWSEECRWKDRHPCIRLDTGTRKIKELINDSRIVVFSYDSTGLLENLALNIPTMCFSKSYVDHLLPSAKPFYELLSEAGILFDSPEQVAEMVKTHWDDISSWWESNKVQQARKTFCEEYAVTVKNPVGTIKRLMEFHASNSV